VTKNDFMSNLDGAWYSGLGEPILENSHYASGRFEINDDAPCKLTGTVDPPKDYT